MTPNQHPLGDLAPLRWGPGQEMHICCAMAAYGRGMALAEAVEYAQVELEEFIECLAGEWRFIAFEDLNLRREGLARIIKETPEPTGGWRYCAIPTVDDEWRFGLDEYKQASGRDYPGIDWPRDEHGEFIKMRPDWQG